MDQCPIQSPNHSLNFYEDITLDQLDCWHGLPDFNLGDGFGGFEEDQFSYSSSSAVTSPLEKLFGDDQSLVGLVAGGVSSSSTNAIINVTPNGAPKMKGDAQKPQRVAFKTKSKHDVLDDGYRWRKYGKKSVKNSPHPRHYYKCTSEGCEVKKKVERCDEDSSIVITQYDGVHTHESPSY